MRTILPVFIILTVCCQINRSSKFEDFIPIKFNVLKVRNISEMQAHAGRHTALDFVSSDFSHIRFFTTLQFLDKTGFA